MPSELYFPRRSTRFTVKEVCWEGFWSAFSASSPCSCLILCLVSWSTSCLKSSLSCQVLHSSLSIVVHSQVVLLQKEWQFFCWGENMHVGLTQNAYWGSWNRRQCLAQMLMQNTCSWWYGYDDGKQPRRVARLEEWLYIFRKKNDSHLHGQISCIKIKTGVLF